MGCNRVCRRSPVWAIPIRAPFYPFHLAPLPRLQVHFSVYMIADTSRHLKYAAHQPHGTPGRAASFDANRFKEEVERLKVAGQQFSFAYR